MPCSYRFLRHSIRNQIFHQGILTLGIQKFWLEASEGVIEDFHERDIYFAHQLRSICLDDIEQRVKHILFCEGCQEMIMKIWILFAVWDLD